MEAYLEEVASVAPGASDIAGLMNATLGPQYEFSTTASRHVQVTAEGRSIDLFPFLIAQDNAVFFLSAAARF